MIIPKETDDDDIVKYKRQGRKLCLNYQVWHENNPNPTEEEANQLIAIAEKYLLSFVNTRIFNGEILTCFAFEILLMTFLVLYLFIKKPKVPLFIP